MALRIPGMNSGMDTEGIIKEMVKAYSVKKEDMVKDQTKLSWKQETWGNLNAKIKKLYKNTLSNLKFQSAYVKKSTTISDSSIAKIVAGDSAVAGTQTLRVDELAKAGYLTGGKLTKKADGTPIDVTGATTLADLGILGSGENATIKVKAGGTEKNIDISADTSIDGFLAHLKDAGVSASFDKVNKRIYVNVEKSGAAADFQMEGVGNNGMEVLSGLRLLTADDVSGLAGYDSMTAAEKQALLDKESASLLSSYKDKYNASVKSLDNLQATLTQRQDATAGFETAVGAYTDSTDPTKYDADVAAAMSHGTDADRKAALTSLVNSTSWKTQLEEAEQAVKDGTATEAQNEFINKVRTVSTLAVNYAEIEATQNAISDTETKRDLYDSYVNNTGNILTNEAQTELADKVQTAKDAAADLGNTTGADYETRAVRVKGQDAVIHLNGAQYTSSTNNFTVNNLTITALEKTEPGKEVSISTAEDIDGVYNVIKGFLKEYNALIKEMDTLYNADKAKGYEPLTEEEKATLSDSEVEKWEKKIKDSVLRRDGNLNSTISIFKNTMMQTYNVNGTEYSLSSFGIETLPYSLAGDNEKGVYHINGDKEDSDTASADDKLKTMLAGNKDDVVGFFTKLTDSMYGQLGKASASIKDYRTFGNFYDDKKLTSDYTNYAKKITEQEKRIAKMEDKYYAQFTAMEVAMSKLNSQQSSLAGLLGG